MIVGIELMSIGWKMFVTGVSLDNSGGDIAFLYTIVMIVVR